jgi:hypothetical protein
MMDEEMFSLEKIPIISIYIRQDGDIIKVVEEQIKLEDDEESGSILEKNRLIDWITHRRILQQIQYRLDDILLFHFVDNESIDNGSFMRGFSILEDIDLEESLCQFHSLSSIYLFFRDSNIKKTPLKILDNNKPVMEIVAIDLDKRTTRKIRNGTVNRGTRVNHRPNH